MPKQIPQHERVCRSALRGGAPDTSRSRTGAGEQHSGAAAQSPARNAPDPAGGAPKTVNSEVLPACVKPHFRAKNVRSVFRPVSVFSHTVLHMSGTARRAAAPKTIPDNERYDYAIRFDGIKPQAKPRKSLETILNTPIAGPRAAGHQPPKDYRQFANRCWGDRVAIPLL